jgi:hypothetical protein
MNVLTLPEMSSLLSNKISKIAILLFVGAATCFAGLNPFGPFWGGKVVPPITVPLAWGEVDCSSSTHCHAFSATQVVTVPVGSSGQITFHTSDAPSYSLNGGGFVLITDGLTIVIVDGTTLRFDSGSLACDGACSQVKITDTVTGTYVGGSLGFTGCNPGFCP